MIRRLGGLLGLFFAIDETDTNTTFGISSKLWLASADSHALPNSCRKIGWISANRLKYLIRHRQHCRALLGQNLCEVAGSVDENNYGPYIASVNATKMTDDGAAVVMLYVYKGGMRMDATLIDGFKSVRVSLTRGR